MPQVAASRVDRVTDTALAWVHGPGASQLRSQVAQWGPSQWRQARGAVQVHGVAPLVYDALRQSGGLAALPRPLARDLETNHDRNTRRVEAVRAVAKQLLALGEAMGMELVTLRDSSLAFHYHPQPALRPTPGVDLLVRPREEARLVSALSRAGWQEILRSVGPPVVVRAERHWDSPGPDAPALQEPCRLNVLTSIDLKSGGLHFDLTWAYWYEARRRLQDDVPGLAPSPLRLMQHVLIQASQSLVALRLRLVDLWDVAAVSRSLSAHDWEILVEEAQDQGEERLFWAPLRLAGRYLGPVALDSVMADLSRGVPASLREWVESAGGDDIAATRLNATVPVKRTCWCRSSWERLFAIRQMLLPLPGEVPTPRLVRSYVHHARGVARWLRSAATRLVRASRARGPQRPSERSGGTAPEASAGGDARISTAFPAGSVT